MGRRSSPTGTRGVTGTAGTTSRLTIRTKVLFGTGDITTSAPQAILSFFQLFFLTDVARLPPAAAGVAILVSKIWDALNDPLTGLAAERVRSRYGRRRILLFVGAPPLSVLFVLMWIVPDLSLSWRVAYYTLVYILFDTTYTIVHVGFNSLTPALARDYDEQSSLNGVRMLFSVGGALAAIIIGTLLQGVFPDEETRFLVFGVVVGLIVLVPPYLVAAVTRRYDTPAASRVDRMGVTVRQVLGNRPFLLVAAIYLASWTAVSIIAADLVYFARYRLRVPDQGSYYVLVAQAMALVMIPVVVASARRSDKRATMILGALSMVPLLGVISLLPPAAAVVAYPLAALLGFGIATTYVIPWSMIPDVIAYGALANGQRTESSYYAVAALIQKTGTAIGLWLMAQALAVSGYVTPAPGAPPPIQPASTVRAIQWFIGPVPALLLVAAAIFARRYALSRDEHRRITLELDGQEG